jgi:hypothetical protein
VTRSPLVAAATPAAPEPTHGCARCGAPVPVGVGLCERCNPLGLRDVAASQAHGTVFVAVFLAVVALALAARLFVAGAGPYLVTVAAVEPAGDALTVTLQVTNDGDAAGQTTCTLTDPAQLAGPLRAFVLTPRIEPGVTSTVTATVREFGGVARPLAAECRTP